MKLNLDTLIHIRGIPVQFREGVQATLGEAARIALNVKTDRRLTLEESVKIGLLSLRFADGGIQEVTPEELTEVRKRLVEAFPSPELVATLYGLLDGKTEALGE